MILTKSFAKKVVLEINEIIDENVNIINKSGYIIASTDKSRVGTIHKGALNIINQNLNELIITDGNTFDGSKQGVNYPLIINNQVIGVIGITGSYDNITNITKLVKKITEINLAQLDQDNRNSDTKLNTDKFYKEWIKSTNNNDPELISLANSLNIDITIKRRFIIYGINHKDKSIIYKDFIDNILDIYNDALTFTHNGYNVLTIPFVEDKSLLDNLTSINDKIFNKYKIHINIGIDDGIININEIIKSINKSLRAYNDSHNSDNNIVFFNDIFEIINKDINPISAIELKNNLFHNIDNQQILEYLRILYSYYKHNRSINCAALDLHMHKNTLQYKLNKIHKITNHNPRIVNDSFIFQLVINIFIDDILINKSAQLN